MIHIVYFDGCPLMKPETGSFIFGVISSLVTGICSLLCIIALFVINWINWKTQQLFGPHEVDDYDDLIFMNIVFVGLTMLFLLNFLFSVLLCDGIRKKKLGQIKAYYVHGVAISLLSVVVDIRLFWMGVYGAAVGLLASLGVYVLILQMINATYNKFSLNQVYQFKHKRLEETAY